MFLAKDPRRKRLGRVVVFYFDNPLDNDRPGVEVIIYEVNGAA